MTYEKTPVKHSKSLGQDIAIKAVDQLSTGRILWMLIKRHKVALLAVGNVVLILNYIFPAWTTFALSLFA